MEWYTFLVVFAGFTVQVACKWCLLGEVSDVCVCYGEGVVVRPLTVLRGDGILTKHSHYSAQIMTTNPFQPLI